MKRKIKFFKKVAFHLGYAFFLCLFDILVTLFVKNAKNPKTFLIIRMDGMGDYVLFRNFINIIKNSKKYQNYHITLCGNVLWKDIAEKFDGNEVDNFIWIDKKKFVYNLKYRKKIIKEISSFGFETAINPVYSRDFVYGDLLIRASRAIERIGNETDFLNILRIQDFFSKFFYTKLFSLEKNVIFEFEKNRKFFEKVIYKKIGIKRPFLNLTKKRKEKYFVVMPGAGAEFRRWNPLNFAKVIDYISEKHEIKKAFIAGSINDRILADEILKNTKSDIEIIITAGDSSLVDFIYLINDATLLISNETGAIHIAVAIQTKAVCVSNGNHFGRFNPYPNNISEDAKYIYPREIRDWINNFIYLVEKFREGSLIDINNILPEDVFSLVDPILDMDSQEE